MREVGVAFPNDEASAQVIASRLRAAGIATRVDRGLWGSWQVGQRGQITVLVDARQERRAYLVLGTQPRRDGTPEPLLRFGIVFVVIALAIGAAVIYVLVSRLV